ncbi:AMP-binding protein [Bradyrhizobium sp. SZCCHNS3051]|uniref:AMP-binding protein n=1 Tax=Bradyrhizobium sp. SZCCHNS3051 TaxID=3057320 RepID=UPI002915EE25|nr:AMP-binding protein [Bradyrhizobium sp. SZCCHNS3051]
MFDALHNYRQCYSNYQRSFLRESWNKLAVDCRERIPVVPVFGSSNLFFPCSFDRQVAAMLEARGSPLHLLQFGSFGFCTSRFVLENVTQLLDWSAQRPLAAVIYEASGNELPAIDDPDLANELRAAIVSGGIVDVETGERIRQFLGSCATRLEHHVARMAELLARSGPRQPVPLILIGQETNCTGWPPALSCYSRRLDARDRRAFHDALHSAAVHLAASNLERASEAARSCAEIDPTVAIFRHLQAKLAVARGDMSSATAHYFAARDGDLLRGRFAAAELGSALPVMAARLGCSYVAVDRIVCDFAGGAPGFESFIDDVHYRPEVHHAIACAVIEELATLGLEASPTPPCETDREALIERLDPRPAMTRLHTALEIAQALPGLLDNERVAAGREALHDARALGCPTEVADQAELRFAMLIDAAVRRMSPQSGLSKTDNTAAPGGPADLVRDILGFDPYHQTQQPDLAAVAAVIRDLLQDNFGLSVPLAEQHRALHDLGLDSLSFVQLLFAIERRFALALTPDDFAIDHRLTLAGLARDVLAHIREPGDRRSAYKSSLSRSRVQAARRIHQMPRSWAPCTLPDDATTFTAALSHQLHCRPETPAFVHLDEGQPAWDAATTTSRQCLAEESARMAGCLTAHGLRAGDEILLLTGHSRATIIAFVAALRLGLVPSILNPPSPKTDLATFLGMYARIADQGLVEAVLAPRQLARHLRHAGSMRPITVLEWDSVTASAPASWQEATPAPQDVALVQYSSGTTGLRKAVAITHGALMSQIRTLGAALELRQQDVVVSWLPLYHDMGLIGAFALPLATGIPFVTMSPFDWIGRPGLLLDAITATRATLAFMPNFAFNVLADQVADRPGWDLSTIRALINCAEPVRPEAWERFLHRFEAYGLSRLAHATCYAMAEATFAVTFAGVATPPLTEGGTAEDAVQADEPPQPNDLLFPGKTMLSSGRPLPGVALRIVDRDGKPLPDLAVGHIEFACPFLAKRHRPGAPDLTELAPEGWYRTGDHGYLAHGHVFVAGRSDDMLIVGGENIFPGDVEDAASTVGALKPGRIAAFGVWDDRLGTERLVVAAELLGLGDEAAALTETQRRLRTVLRSAVNVMVSDVVLLPPGTLPKTSSGKLERAHIRSRYAKGGFNAVRLA